MRWQNKTEVFKKSKKKNQDKNQTSEVKYDQLHSMFKSHGEKMLKLCTTAKAFHDRVTKNPPNKQQKKTACSQTSRVFVKANAKRFSLILLN